MNTRRSMRLLIAVAASASLCSCAPQGFRGLDAGAGVNAGTDPPPDACRSIEAKSDCCAASCMWLNGWTDDGIGCIRADAQTCESDDECPSGTACVIETYPCSRPDACAAVCETAVSTVGHCV